MAVAAALVAIAYGSMVVAMSNASHTVFEFLRYLASLLVFFALISIGRARRLRLGNAMKLAVVFYLAGAFVVFAGGASHALDVGFWPSYMLWRFSCFLPFLPCTNV